MSGAESELQGAILSALNADASLVAALGAGRIFDRAPPHTPFPYITFGRTSAFDWSTGTDSGSEQLVTLHVWSKAKGRKETLELIEAARAVLDDAQLTMDGHHLVSLRADYSEARYDEDLAVHHGLLRFRAVTEKAG
jgi:hypothetical protein